MNKTWKSACFTACVREADKNLEFTNKNLVKNQLSTIITETNTKGKTPQNTLSRILQNFRDSGLINFIKNGIYQFRKIHLDMRQKRKNMSNGEKMIYSILMELGIDFFMEKTFDNLKDKGFLRFDFYFEINSIEFAIEYDGLQHKIPIKHFGGEEAFNVLKNHDELKTKYCKENNIHLIRIDKFSKAFAFKKIIQEIINK
jgi:hypothetical protein